LGRNASWHTSAPRRLDVEGQPGLPAGRRRRGAV